MEVYVEDLKGNNKEQMSITVNGVRWFSSYGTTIARQDDYNIYLSKRFWDYSPTTLKYLKLWLRTSDTKAEIQAKIDAGIYKEMA